MEYSTQNKIIRSNWNKNNESECIIKKILIYDINNLKNIITFKESDLLINKKKFYFRRL